VGYFELATLEVIVIGVLCGIVGTIVVLRERSFFTVALTHATFPGGVIAAILGVNILLGAALFSVVLVLIMVGIGRVGRQGSQVASGVVLTFGFALGSLVQSLNPSLPVHVDTFLVGSVLTVESSDVLVGAITLAFSVLAIVLVGKELLFSTFDGSGFRAAGYRESVIDLVALALIAATVVSVMPAVGSILAIALIVAPPAAARLVTNSVPAMMGVAIGIAVASGVLGLWLSRWLGVAAGGAITLTAAGFFVIALGASRVTTLRLKA
jgi:zinc/manganese transport system permease protein